MNKQIGEKTYTVEHKREICKKKKKKNVEC